MRRFCLTVLATLPFLSGPALAAGSYRLGPADELRVSVFDFRSNSGDPHEWKGVSGKFVISASGEVSLPLIGELEASGLTTEDLARSISDRLKKKIGLAQAPVASVEVAKYRPFYVLGAVATPGAYPYKPQLTAIQALSLAGGVLRATANGGQVERDELTSRGQLRVLDRDRISLALRIARLKAELAGSQKFPLPSGINAADPEVQTLLREEQLLLQARQESLNSQLETLASTKTVLQKQIEVLKAKSASLDRQSNLANKELKGVNGLVAKGLAVSSRQLEVEQNAAHFETSKLDVSLAMLRAQQDAAQIDQQVAHLKGKWRSDVLVELSAAHAKLAQVKEQMETERALTENADLYGGDSVSTIGGLGQPVYTVTRKVDHVPKVIRLTASDPVLPGDVLMVQRAGVTDMRSQGPGNLAEISQARAPAQAPGLGDPGR